MKIKLNRLIYFIFSCFVFSCTLDKTDYEAEINTVVDEHLEFKEATSLTSGIYKISIEALNGTFYKGYNEIRVKITNSQTNQNAEVSECTFLPVRIIMNDVSKSCPHQYQLTYNASEKYFSGYVVYNEVSASNTSWNLYLSFKIGSQTFNVNKSISVQVQNNKNLNMTEFTGNDGENYCIALVSPQKPSVAENILVAGIYQNKQSNAPSGTFPDPSQFTYKSVRGYTLQIDPRMPEPSMGNHSSPNNKDLTQQTNGLYQGVVNYTMTGNWTLNFILVDQNGKIIKGTKVSKDFTPGVQGVKSELYIDILF